MKRWSMFCVGLSFVIMLGAANAHALIYRGVDFPDGDVSFADAVFSYTPGANAVAPYNANPAGALGEPDWEQTSDADKQVALGNGGELIVQFLDNALTTSGDNSLDLWIFEIGAAVEPTSVAISTDANSWIEVGNIGGATSGIDIDAFIGSGIELWEQFRYVKLTDLNAGYSGYPYGGADIDAVGAISSVPEPGTVLLLGVGLVGIAGFRRRTHTE